MTLRELKAGQSCRVEAVGGEGALRQHFLDMGIIPGAEITIVKFAPMGDPVEVRIHGYELSLMEGMEGYEDAVKNLKNSMLSSLMASKVLKMSYADQGVNVLGETFEADAALFLSTVKAQIADFIEDHELTDEELPEGEYDTVAGFVVEPLGTIPKEDEHPVVTYRSLTFTVLEVTDRRVSRLRIERDPEWTPDDDADEK